MMTTSKIAVLCNNRMAIPALQALSAQGRLCALGVAEGNTDVIDFCIMLSKQSSIPLFIIKKEILSSQLEELMKKTNAEFIFTMTFPWKIPLEVLNKHPGKFYNFHYGLLPEMRGADPVFESIRSEAEKTGITVHAIENKIDKGAIILKKILPLSIKMTHGVLCTNLSWLGANLLNELLILLKNNSKGTKQDEHNAKYFTKPVAADVCISWQRYDAKTIEALSRACNPWNKGAYTQWNGWNIRVVEATVINEASHQSDLPGTILTLDEDNGLIVKCNNETQLRLDIIYTDEGFMSGHKLFAFGMKKGSRFVNL
ncbi:Methionyl-tRNA formyltransferase [Chryseobacterium sp. MOF25P]|jgi:methionyl-tRNA formyltransferase|uniref:formyltransferase family protein n=1 Tax=unclassified Chryseobacterium TaxID=2593645 RepID=UPI000805BA6C|nr:MULTISPECIES: formyltransferase family protein [unclassified Chryseobacterium]MDY0932705.1 formyltransferase family protein [Chryseobacterium sp. CFBP8996]OBW40761.1 Methionyl-tRNA formyltransferase [Chryseobacterium sp. MOF25P]OBW44283.1 Methionyl-tRNA formyltransferase [Chryseobacterium sp. BGARF1]